MIDYVKIMEKLDHDFSQKKIMVIGDLMVDEYVTGEVSRISPEAPVPVLLYKEKKMVAGGAANVAANLNALGAAVKMVGIAANDIPGNWLRKSLESIGIDVTGIISIQDRPTVTKTRFSTNGQQLIRVDNEISDSINDDIQKRIIKYIQSNVGLLDGIVLSDYRKGLFSNSYFIQNIIDICNKNNIFVSIDSKSREIEAFKGADLVKPNNLELSAAIGIKIKDDESLEKAGRKYLQCSKTKALLVTRGAKGISLFREGIPREDYPSVEVQVYDVTGAGDTVISTVTLGILSGLCYSEAIVLANIAAGIVISSVGTAAVNINILHNNIMQYIK